MELSEQIYNILTGLATQLPSLLTMVGGIVFALLRWKFHPKVSVAVMVSLGLMILHVIAFAIIYSILPLIFGYRNYRLMQTYQTFVSLAYNFLLALITVILLAAIFMWRNSGPGEPVIEPAAAAKAA